MTYANKTAFYAVFLRSAPSFLPFWQCEGLGTGIANEQLSVTKIKKYIL